MIQLGDITDDKLSNIAHAREMVLKAVEAEGEFGRADMVMLPVSPNVLCGLLIVVGLLVSWSSVYGEVSGKLRAVLERWRGERKQGSSSPPSQAADSKEGEMGSCCFPFCARGIFSVYFRKKTCQPSFC
jgi:hypothetical protein